MKRLFLFLAIGLLMVSCKNVEEKKTEEKKKDENSSFTYLVTRIDEDEKIMWNIAVKREDDGFSQDIIVEHDEIGIGLFPSEDSMVEVRDVNFDGYEDITVHKGNYGVQGTEIYEAYIWDENTKSLIWNESFNVIPNPEIDYENEVVLGENRESSLSYDYFVYKYEHGEYVNTDIMNATFVEDENMHVIEKKLIDNEMKEVFNDIVSYEEYKERYEQMKKSSALEVTPTPEPDMEGIDDELTLMQKALLNKEKIKLVDTKESKYLNEILEVDSYGEEGKVKSEENDFFYYVDMDGNGTKEVALSTTYLGGNFIVLFEVDGEIYAQVLGYRSMNPLYNDGVAAASDGAAYSYYYKVKEMTQNGIVDELIVYIVSDDNSLPDNIARYYTKDNYQEEITHEEFKELMKSYSFEEKEDSYWGFSRKEEYVATEYDFSEEVIREILSVKK